MFWTVATVWTAAVITPGLNFLAVTRNSLNGGRATGLATTFGVVTGTFAQAMAGWAGISALFAAFPQIFRALVLAGAAWILWSGVRLLLKARDGSGSAGPQPVQSPFRAWRQGLLTALSNPKSLIFLSSLFAAVLPRAGEGIASLWIPALIVTISLSWYALVALALSAPPVSARFTRHIRLIDTIAGLAFIAIALRLILG